MSDGLVSCVVPVFNAGAFLRETLEHVLAQTYRDLEVVVVDDGSTDGSAGVTAAFGERVRCLTQANRGENAARNTGLKACRGRFIAFCDADDLWHPHKLDRQIATFRQDPRLDVSFTQFQNFEERASTAGRTRHAEVGGEGSGYLPSTLVARREAFERYGAFPAADRNPATALWVLRARAQGARVEILPEVLLSRRLHADNLSRSTGGSVDHLFPILKTWLDFKRTSYPGTETGQTP